MLKSKVLSLSAQDVVSLNTLQGQCQVFISDITVVNCQDHQDYLKTIDYLNNPNGGGNTYTDQSNIQASMLQQTYVNNFTSNQGVSYVDPSNNLIIANLTNQASQSSSFQKQQIGNLNVSNLQNDSIVNVFYFGDYSIIQYASNKFIAYQNPSDPNATLISFSDGSSILQLNQNNDISIQSVLTQVYQDDSGQIYLYIAAQYVVQTNRRLLQDSNNDNSTNSTDTNQDDSQNSGDNNGDNSGDGNTDTGDNSGDGDNTNGNGDGDNTNGNGDGDNTNGNGDGDGDNNQQTPQYTIFNQIQPVLITPNYANGRRNLQSNLQTISFASAQQLSFQDSDNITYFVASKSYVAILCQTCDNGKGLLKIYSQKPNNNTLISTISGSSLNVMIQSPITIVEGQIEASFYFKSYSYSTNQIGISQARMLKGLKEQKSSNYEFDIDTNIITAPQSSDLLYQFYDSRLLYLFNSDASLYSAIYCNYQQYFKYYSSNNTQVCLPCGPLSFTSSIQSTNCTLCDSVSQQNDTSDLYLGSIMSQVCQLSLNSSIPILTNKTNSSSTQLTTSQITAIAVCIPVGVTLIVVFIIAIVIVRKKRHTIQKSNSDEKLKQLPNAKKDTSRKENIPPQIDSKKNGILQNSKKDVLKKQTTQLNDNLESNPDEGNSFKNKIQRDESLIEQQQNKSTNQFQIHQNPIQQQQEDEEEEQNGPNISVYSSKKEPRNIENDPNLTQQTKNSPTRSDQKRLRPSTAKQQKPVASLISEKDFDGQSNFSKDVKKNKKVNNLVADTIENSAKGDYDDEDDNDNDNSVVHNDVDEQEEDEEAAVQQQKFQRRPMDQKYHQNNSNAGKKNSQSTRRT